MLLNSNPSSFFIPDFVEIQRKSFLDLLEKGLINEIKKRNFISTPNNDVQLIFYPDYYQLNPPEWTPKQAILKSKSYTCRLYVPAQLINNLTKKINLQWVLLGNLPLMTKRGHFIINGSPRIIINQMVRSPGIYYQETIDKNKKRSYYADLISHRGTWLRLETDKKQRVWARMKKTPKVSILIFLQSFGLPKERVFQSIHYSNFLKNSFLKQNHPISTEQALIALYSKIHPKKDKAEVTPEMGHKFLFRKFMNPRTYDLGKLGRLQLNKKLGLSVSLNIYTLTPQDILFAVDYLIKLEHGVGSIDDIDHLKNRRVRASGELVQNQLGTGLIRLEKMIREKLKKPKKNLTIRSLITTKPVNGALREFFGSSPLSQFMDQTNPLAEITHKRRLSSLGPGGVSRETAGMAVRGIHPSHYGRICPIETPEGPNAGLVNSITTYARINSEGFLETPFYNVSQGQIQKKQSPIFFSAEHEENLNVAPGDLKSNILNFLPKNLIPIRNSDEFKLVSRDQVHYIAISPIQMISIATSLIPFLEHNDANRALMGSNMQRQAVPLIAPERPVIGTGLEARVVSDSGHIIQAETSGFVSYVSGDKIVIQTFFPLKFNSPEIPSYRKSFDSRMLTPSGRPVPFPMVGSQEDLYQEIPAQMVELSSLKSLTQSNISDSSRVLVQKNLNSSKKRKSKTHITLLNSHLLIEGKNKKITSNFSFQKLEFNFNISGGGMLIQEKYLLNEDQSKLLFYSFPLAFCLKKKINLMRECSTLQNGTMTRTEFSPLMGDPLTRTEFSPKRGTKRRSQKLINTIDSKEMFDLSRLPHRCQESLQKYLTHKNFSKLFSKNKAIKFLISPIKKTQSQKFFLIFDDSLMLTSPLGSPLRRELCSSQRVTHKGGELGSSHKHSFTNLKRTYKGNQTGLESRFKIKNTNIFNNYASQFSFGLTTGLIKLYSNQSSLLSRELCSSQLFSHTFWSILQKSNRFFGTTWDRKTMQFKIFKQTESFNNCFDSNIVLAHEDLEILYHLGWDHDDFKKICLINKKSLFTNSLLKSGIKNKKDFRFYNIAKLFDFNKVLLSQRGYPEDLRIITHEETKKFNSNRVLPSEMVAPYGRPVPFPMVGSQEDLKNFRFSKSLDSLKFSNNNLFWNQYDLSKRATSRNKRGFLVFNFKYKIQNHFVESIRTGELLSLLMCQTKNILNFSNTLFSREINKPNLLVSKNALQINSSWFSSNKDCLGHPKEQSLELNRIFAPYGRPVPFPMVGSQEDSRYEFLFKTKKAQIGNTSTNLARLEQSSTIREGSPLWATRTISNGREPRGEFGISKKKFVNRLIILNSQKTYFQSIIKTFLFSFFNKKITSFYLRPWNSFFYLFYSQKNSFFFFPIDKNFQSYSSTLENGRMTRTEFLSTRSIRESFLFQLDYFFLGSPNNKKSKNFLDSRSFKLPMVPSTMIERSRILVAPEGSPIRDENFVGANVFVINNNLVGIKSNSKIQTIRNKFILIRECSPKRKSISSNSLPSMSLLAQQKSQKYGAFLNKKFNFKTDDSMNILPAQMVESKRQTFDLTTKTPTQFEDSEISNPNKFSWFDSNKVLDPYGRPVPFPMVGSQEEKNLLSSRVSKEVTTGYSVWQSLNSLKGISIRNSNRPKTKKLLDFLPNSSLTSIRESLVTSPSTHNSIVYNLQNYQRSNQDTCLTQNPVVYEGEWIQKGDLLADGAASLKGELALGKNILIGYMPWEGYNFEDAILINERLIYDDIYTSIHIERYEVEIRDTKFGVEQITNQIPEIDILEISHLDNSGISKIGTWVKEADILVGKVTPIQKKLLSPHEKLLYDIVGKDIPTTRDTSLRLPKSVEGRVVDIQVLETENIPPEIAFEGPGRVHIYVAEKRKIQVGDKMAGRHGNKGIVSKILPRQDMPYLPDGTPIDMVLNPLGVPSRMNVGQVFECLLGLAGKYLGQQFKIVPFDEIYGPEASRSLVYSKLFEASLKTGQDWLFHPNFPGKTKLFDGRTGDCFEQAVTIGQAYMLKLVHLVDEKIHARSTGPYSLVTQQPLRGRSKHGGQRLGEMEVWALEGFGAAYTLQELLTVKSDDMKGRHQVMDAILNNKTISLGTPESFKVLIRELQSLCLDVGVYSIDSTGHRKQIDVMKLP